MNIRLANLNDAKALSDLYAQLNSSDPSIELNVFCEKLSVILHSEHLHLFVLEVDQIVVATCYLNVIENLTRNLTSYAIIENVVTDVNYRAQGLGKAVVKVAVRHAFTLGCYKVMLQTGSKKTSTLKFYASCGFKSDQKTAFVAKPDSILS